MDTPACELREGCHARGCCVVVLLWIRPWCVDALSRRARGQSLVVFVVFSRCSLVPRVDLGGLGGVFVSNIVMSFSLFVVGGHHLVVLRTTPSPWLT